MVSADDVITGAVLCVAKVSPSSSKSSPYIRPRSGRGARLETCSPESSSFSDGLAPLGLDEVTLLSREREVETDLQALDDEIGE